MGLFSRTKKNNNDIAKDSDWSKDLKRNNKAGNVGKQQKLYFEKNTYIKGGKPIFGTKLGLSINGQRITSAQVEVLKKCQAESSAAELIKILNRTNKTKFKQTVLNPLIESGFLALTIPERPKSPKQKYQLTGKFVKK